jgi:hypothetical protein
MYWAIGLEAHPLNAARTGLKSRHVHFELFEVSLAGTRNVGWNPNVVISPAMHRNGRWGLVTFSGDARAKGRLF